MKNKPLLLLAAAALVAAAGAQAATTPAEQLAGYSAAAKASADAARDPRAPHRSPQSVNSKGPHMRALFQCRPCPAAPDAALTGIAVACAATLDDERNCGGR